MSCTKEHAFRFGDSFLLFLVFIFQSVTINFLIISHFNASSLHFLWFALDFLCVLIFSLSLFLAFRSSAKKKKRIMERSRNSFVDSVRTDSRLSTVSSSNHSNIPTGFKWFAQLTSGDSTLSYGAWLFFVITLIAKVALLFKSNVPQRLSSEDKGKGLFLGPQMLNIAIGSSAIIYWLLVKAHHHHEANEDPMRNTYIKCISHEVAMEIFDSVSYCTRQYIDLDIFKWISRDDSESPLSPSEITDLIMWLISNAFFCRQASWHYSLEANQDWCIRTISRIWLYLWLP